MTTHLTGAQLQWLIDKFSIVLDTTEGGSIRASRKDGRPLKAATVAKMVGLKTTPENWKEDEDGGVLYL